jgi:ABC-type polysaccharide/polyol phosphate export permease
MTTTIYDSAQPRRPLLSEFRHFWTYRGLIRLLVNRDLTVRYKRSLLGVWWTLLNPLLTAGIMYLIFGQLFGSRFGATDEPYVVYLLSGVMFMTFFSQGVMATGSAIAGASGILSKVYVPAEVFSISTALAAGVNFAISLIPLVAAQLIAGVGIPWTILLVPIPALAMLALVAGLGLLIAAAAVFFYDVLDLTRVGVQLITYLTPMFWPVSIIPEQYQPLLRINPLFSYLEVFRGFMYRGEFAEWWAFAIMLISALLMLVLGVWVFTRSWRQMVGAL